MGGCFSSSSADNGMHIPAVKRQKTTDKPSESELPLGAVLTGAQELRQQQLLGQGVRVAVIDSGIDQDHPGFGGKVTRKTWYRSGTPLSKDDHGTHVAGTIHFMAPQAEIYDYRVFGAKGKVSVTEAIAQAIYAAADVGCQVINMSLGGPVSSPSIEKAVKYGASKNVVMVCAAGNEGDNNPLTNERSYPAFYEECISIAAVSKKNGFPVAVFSNSNSQVDYAGIGVDVASMEPGGGYQTMSGTSMASPHVAGLIACLLSDNSSVKKNIDDKALRTLLNESYALDIAAEGIDTATGVGFLTALDANAFDELLPRKKEGLVPARVK